MRSVLIGFEYPCGTLRIIFAQNPIRRSARNLRSRNFPAVRDGESADTVIIDGDMLGGNAVLLLRMVHVDMVDQLR